MYFPPRQAGPQFGTEVKGPATGCVTMNQNVTCNTTGGCSISAAPFGTSCTGSFLLQSNQTEIASVQASVTFGPLLAPGVYRYFCFYHQAIGMEGYLVVMPNKGFTSSPPSG
jgi:plastocyanin